MNADIHSYLERFSFRPSLFADPMGQTRIDYIQVNDRTYRRFTNEYWTSQQRQSNSIHEISYRACFKAQLPRFFIDLLTSVGDTVFDPFAGRGTTALESAILSRNVAANDVNPLSQILTKPRLLIPLISDIENRLRAIPTSGSQDGFDLSMFYHEKTQDEIKSLKEYLQRRRESGEEDEIDAWIRMVATNRLTGHSSGFFSVYTLPPNQAVKRENQAKINEQRKQQPPYRDTKSIILRKSHSLLSDMTPVLRSQLRSIGSQAAFMVGDARGTSLRDESIALTVTSPPFLDIVAYADDNWLRGWFNSLDVDGIAQRITVLKNLEAWSNFMLEVFKELFRVTKTGGSVAFEVGEVRNGKIKLDEVIIPVGEEAGFSCRGVVVNLQNFTKTSNIWGVSNNRSGTNTNRIVLFEKM